MQRALFMPLCRAKESNMSDYLDIAFNEDGKGVLTIGADRYRIEAKAWDEERLHRFFVYPKETNSNGEKIVLEFSIGYWEGKSGWDEWVKLGYTEKKDTLLFLYTYVTDKDGNCLGAYNPQHKRSEDGKREVVDFDYLPEATAEGYRLLIDETMRRFKEAI